MAWLCSSGFGPTTVQAQTPATAAPKATPDAAIDFDIPAQPMASALNNWAVQANAQVFVDPAPVAHLMAPAVKGTLTPRQALRALLARSNLQVAQGANGVFVIKPRPAVAAAPAPATPAATTVEEAVPPPAAPPGPPTARAVEGPWMAGLAAEYLRDHGTARAGAAAAVAGEYFITDHVVAAIAITTPRTHTFEVPASSAVPAGRGSARLLSSTLTLKYYLAPNGRLRPYLGAGVDVTTLYGAKGVAGLDRVTAGPAVEAGLDLSLNPHWLLNAGVGWERVPEIHLDPVQFGLGFAYRFGGSAP
jgi:outer membrane protein W